MNRWRSAGTIALIAIIVFGIAATFLALSDARADVREADRRGATLAATRLSGALEFTLAAVRGADALAADGTVTSAEFEAFAKTAIRDSLYGALAYAEVVDARDRADFVRRTGVTISDTDGAGGFVVAPQRPRSLVIVEVYPSSSVTRPLVGFDIAGEPTRKRAADAAASSLTPVLSDRTTTVSGAVAGLSVVQAVRTPDGAVVGFVTSGLTVADLAERAQVETAGPDVGLWMDGEMLTSGAPTMGSTATFAVAGRTFVVRTSSGQDIRLLFPLLIALGTVALAITVGIASRGDRRRQEKLARFALHNRGIAELGQRLSSSNDTANMLTAVATHSGAILDDAVVVVARRSADDAAVVQIDQTSTPLLDSTADWLLAGPISRTLGTGEPTLIAQLDDRSAAAAPMDSIVCMPLRFSGGYTFGALLLGWRGAMTTTDLDERSVAVTTIAELASSALERAVVADVVRTGAERLSAFTRTLATARSPGDVSAAVSEFVPGIVGAGAADLDVDLDLDIDVDSLEAGPRDRVTRRVIRNSDNEPVGLLTLHWRQSAAVSTTQHALTITLADLIEQTLGRIALSQQEHDVIVQLQRDLLPPPPEVGWLDVAVGYQPAMSVVGLGGDFYDFIVSDTGRVFAVIGDIAGHGSQAVAVMSELKSVVQHLLRSGASISTVCAQADLLLLRRDMLATAQICEFDVDQQVLRYVNAGHPYPILRQADGTTTTLRSGHRPLLGLTGSSDIHNDVASTPFSEGDVLLLYTDGLIERRDQLIDDAIDDLVHLVRDQHIATMDVLVSDLQQRLLRPDERSDDDVALLAVRCLDSRAGEGHDPQTTVISSAADGSAARVTWPSRPLRDHPSAIARRTNLGLSARSSPGAQCRRARTDPRHRPPRSPTRPRFSRS